MSFVCSSLLSFSVGKPGSSGSSASFGSPVPFATWSPFGTSQGFLFLCLAWVSGSPSRGGLPLDRVSVPFSSDSFESAVPLATWSPFGMSQGLLVLLSRSGLRVPFLWCSPFGVVYTFHLLLCHIRVYGSLSDLVALWGCIWLSLGLCLILVSGFLTGGVLLFVLVPFGWRLGLLQALSLVYFSG